MGIITKSGYDYAFDEKACKACGGKCCTGESGYIWVSKEEISAFADFFSINSEEFISLYLKKVNFRYTIKEIECEKGFACIFFDSGSASCKVYDIRPSQCRAFPFWEYFKHNKKELERECMGVL